MRFSLFDLHAIGSVFIVYFQYISYVLNFDCLLAFNYASKSL